MRESRILCVPGLMILFLVCCAPAYSQVPTGTPPFGSFGGGPDVINLSNLNAHLSVPVFNKAGRGTPFFYNLTYDSSIWYPLTSGSTTTWQPVNYWGWGIQTAVATGYVSYSTTSGVCYVNGHDFGGSYTNFLNWSYNDQFGVTHKFGGSSAIRTGTCGSSTGMNSLATDGSGLRLTSTLGASSITVTSRGAKVIQPPFLSASGAGTTTDSNGNQISVSSSGVFTDTLDKTVLTVSQNAPGPSSPTTFTYTPPSGTNTAYTMQYINKTVQTAFGCSGIGEYTSASPVALVSEIDLPDATKYLFTYEPTPGASSNVTGRLASVTLPTGGVITYTYTGGSGGIECPDGSTAGLTRVTPDGSWTYSRALGTSPATTTTITDPDGNKTVINFQGIYETERQVNQGAASLLKTTFTCYNGGTPNCNSTAITIPILSRAQYFEWPTSNLESEVNTAYNTYGLVTEKDEYAYGTSAPGAIVRKTITTYDTTLTGLYNRPKTVTVEDGSSNIKSQTTYTYDEAGTLTATSGVTQHVSVTNSRGNATTISSLVGATSLTKHYTYYDTGTVNVATDVNGATTTYSYGTGSCDSAFATSVAEPLSLTRSMTWNCVGGVQASLTDENGLQTSTGYTTDPYFWRPNSKTDAASDVTTFTYTGATEVESSMPFNSGASTIDIFSLRDSSGRLQLSQRKQGPSATNYDSVETSYDAEGRPNKTTLPYVGTAGQLNSTASNKAAVYDALGRKTSVTDSGGMSTTLTYASNDVYRDLGPHPIGENDKRKQFEYDALGRLTSVCEVTSATGGGSCAQTSALTGFWTTYTYDVANNLTGVTQNAQSTGSKQYRTYTYDDLSRLTSEINPESGTTATTYTYDTDSTCGTTSSGDLVKKVDQVGNRTCYTYDLLHRMTTATVTGTYGGSVTPIKTFVYDSATVNSVVMTNVKGRLAEAYTCLTSPCTSKITDVGLSYSTLGWASNTYEMTQDSPSYYHVSEGYHPNGAISNISLSGLPSLTYGVDGEGRTNSVSAASGQNPLTGTTYNAASEPLTVTLGSLDNDAFTYDPNTDRATKYQFNVNGQSITGTLTWNAIGTLGSLAIVDPFFTGDNQTCTYTHDDLARIASVNCGTPWSQTFTYDAFGNLTKSGTMSFSPTYSYATNRMTQIGSSTPTYDLNGNVTNDFLHTYSWDATGRPVTIDGVTVIYDALGRMVEQNKSGVVTEIVYSPSGAKLAIMNGATLKTGFVSLPGGSMAAYNSSGLAYYRHSDWLGSSRFASTTTRTMYSDAAYGPFGEPYAQTGTTDVSFTGMNQDTAANLYDFPAREYGTQGRWPSPDPSGISSVRLTNPQTLDRYAYTGNSPMGFVDPTGMTRTAPGLLGFGGGGYGYLLGIAVGMGFGSGPADGPDPFGFGPGPSPVQSSPTPSASSAGTAPPSLADQVAEQAWNMFGIVMLSFTPSTPEQNGSFTGLDPSDFDIFTVTNDSTTCDLSCMAAGAPPQGGAQFTYGYTDPSNPYVNYSAVGEQDGMLTGVQVWELGNSLALITGTDPSTIIRDPNNPGYNEPGASFCDAVLTSACFPHPGALPFQ